MSPAGKPQPDNSFSSFSLSQISISFHSQTVELRRDNIMDSGKKSPRKVLLDWYADQRPLTIDIVGDFAGNELFLIHGESLIRHCLAQSKVDFNGKP